MTRAGTTLRIYYFAAFSALGINVPFLPVWLEARGLRGIEMSSLIAVRPAIGIFAPIVFGLVADAFQLRRALVRVGCFLCTLVFAVLSLAVSENPELGFGQLLLLLSVFAFFRTPMTTIADVAALEGKTSYGVVRLWGSVGFMLTAVLAGRFVDPRSPLEFPLAMTLALALSFVVSFALPGGAVRAPAPFWRDARSLFTAGDFRLFLLATVLWQVSHAAYDLCISLHLRDLGASGAYVGASWAFGTLSEVGLMAVAHRFVIRHGALWLLVLAFASAAVRWLLLSELRSLPVLMALQPLHALTFALAWIAALSWVKQRAGAHVMGTAQGLFAAAMGVGATLGFLGWGPLYERAGGSVVFGCAALIAMLSAATVFLVRTRASPAAVSTV